MRSAREVERRLDAVARRFASVSATDLSHRELVAIAKSRRLQPKHIRVLFGRIEAPFTASVLNAAADYRRQRMAGSVITNQWPTCMTLAHGLSYSFDYEMDHGLQEWFSFFRRPLQDPKGPMTDVDFRIALANCLLDRRGLDTLRSEVTELAEDPGSPRWQDLVPPLTEEAKTALELVDEFESFYFKFDIPLLMWRADAGQYMGSHKTSRTGQRWT